jgi:hypothetical protein
MNEHELESLIMTTLANAGGFVDFRTIEQAVAQAEFAKGWSDTVRCSYVRGAVGRMIRDGRIVRMKNTAKYKIGDETLNIFQ